VRSCQRHRRGAKTDRAIDFLDGVSKTVEGIGYSVDGVNKTAEGIVYSPEGAEETQDPCVYSWFQAFKRFAAPQSMENDSVRFEVASIRPGSTNGRLPSMEFTPGRGVCATTVALKMLIRRPMTVSAFCNLH
jgi:hypothetical protein